MLGTHIPGSRMLLALCAAAALLAACGTGSSSDEGERVYGTPVDPETLFPTATESTAAQREAREVEIARCLAAKGAVLYGASWCPYTRQQISSFGDGFGDLKYVECAEREEWCADEHGVQSFPTWVLGDRRLVGYRPPETLAEFAGCD